MFPLLSLLAFFAVVSEYFRICVVRCSVNGFQDRAASAIPCGSGEGSVLRPVCRAICQRSLAVRLHLLAETGDTFAPIPCVSSALVFRLLSVVPLHVEAHALP